MPTLSRLLVANRGEIALRVMRTARRMGLSTVAVFSDADRHAPHVQFADDAVRVGPAPATASYLDVDALVRAVRSSGADAVHPGYGFLSENPDFAQAVIDAGAVFVGPPPSAIRAMGLKREAKALVGARGVPLVPGSDGGDQTDAALAAAALQVGLPVILKPSAGGGGKGMKIVRHPGELEAAIASARREAVRAFGDGTLIIERYLERPRHVEIQLIADHHGAVVHLGERECSVQRRHQKVIEEAPSPVMTAERRAAMGRAAVEVARAVGYVNAGTVEFIVDRDGQFYFSEMNTRLQVEHRVTELVTGLDLVQLQLEVAGGEPLRLTQDDVRLCGHAVEVRLYAEDAARDFLPVTGTVCDWLAPGLGGVVVDAGVATGSEVGTEYDPMLAKIIASGRTRDEATGLATRALTGLSVLGLTTNRDFLVHLLSHPRYRDGDLHTGFIAEVLAEGPLPAPPLAELAVVATLAGHARRPPAPSRPRVTPGYRNNRWADQAVTWKWGDAEVTVEYRPLGGGEVLVRSGGAEGRWRVELDHAPVVWVEAPDGRRSRFRVVERAGVTWVHGPRGQAGLEERPRFPPPVDEGLKGGLIAPMPGKVVKVLVSEGQAVTRGQPLVVLEAMKMEQTVVAPADGTVRAVGVKEQQQISAGAVLLIVE